MMNRLLISASLISYFLFLFTDLGIGRDIDRSSWKANEEIDRFYGEAASERGAASQIAALRKIESLVERSGDMSVSEAVLQLGRSIWKLSRYNIFQVKERFHVFDKVRESLISIPGHARYFADEIKREQKEVARYPTNTGPRGSYDSHRSSYFETLSLLPSPETISVLGDFLSDDIDTPVPLRSPDSDWGDNPRANSYAASYTIMNIGLRNPPTAKGTYDADPDAHLAKTRAWWEKVKSGELTFSFLGQKVEYRFKLDGTWETIALANPPNDAPEATKAKDSNEERSAKRPSQPPERQDHPRTSSWIWILGGLLLAGTIGYWAWRKSVTGPK